MKDGDYWTVDFDYTNTDDAKVTHCKQPDQCDNDPYAFHMTKKNGHLSFPYDVDNGNHYALGKTELDLLQCRVIVNLHGYEIEATVYDVKGEQKGSQDGCLENKNDLLTVKGLPLDLGIIYQADDNNPLAFNYGAASFWDTDLMKFFFWESTQQGSSMQVADGRYCTIDTEGNQKIIDCYFPCVAAS